VNNGVKRGIASCLKQIYNLNSNSRVLFTVDGGRKPVFDAFHEAVTDVTQNIGIIDLDNYRRPLTEVPGELETMLEKLKPDIAVNLFEADPKERPIRIAQITRLIKYGAAVAHCPGINPGMIRDGGPFENDFEILAQRGKELTELFEQYQEFEIRSGQGEYVLKLSVEDRKWKNDLAPIRAGMGNLPPGEICVGPIEDSANGKVMVRGRAGEYHLDNYAVLTWEDGVLVDIGYHDNEIVPQLIGNLDKKHSRIIGELGIGFNPTADPSADILESEKSAVHIARGPQMDMGSVIQAEDHLDFLVLSGQVYGIDAAGVKHPIYPPEIREIR
jgi:hypothetical protein